MRVLVFLVQLLISAFVTASLMPVLLATVPASREQGAGLGMMATLLVVTFLIVSLVWPARRRKR